MASVFRAYVIDSIGYKYLTLETHLNFVCYLFVDLIAFLLTVS